MDESPALRVLRGTPNAEELAALVGVLVLHTRSTAGEPAPVVSPWRASALPRAGLRPGPGAWRASAHPG